MARYTFSIFLSLFLFTAQLMIAQNSSSSILADGQIYKIAIPKTGVYKLDYSFFKDDLNIDIDNIKPENIKIYGNNGGLLPLRNNKQRADDLLENSIYIEDGNDGQFNTNDRILFYAEGADRIKYEENIVRYEKNIYDTNNYYFIKIDESPHKNIASTPSISAVEYLTNTEKLQRHEVDLENLLATVSATQGSGKLWLGEAFTVGRELNLSSSFDFNGINTTVPVEIFGHLVARSESVTSFEVTIGGDKFYPSISSTTFSNLELNQANENLLIEEVNLSSNSQVVVKYNSPSGQGEGWIDYLQAIGSYQIQVGNSPTTLFHRSSSQSTTSGFEFTDSNDDLTIWDVSNIGNVQAIEFEKTGNKVSFGYQTDNVLKHFVAFRKNGEFLRPIAQGQIDNQNLHGIERTNMVILYHPNFKEAAEKLATYRSSQDDLTIELVNILDIYNEFGSGKADPVAIRDFARMIHLRDSNFKYLLLFGDASFDYKGLTPNIPLQNFVPTYQTDKSLNPVDAFPSDDFFALLSEDEGADNMAGDLDIGTGRIPCTNLEDGLAFVNKIVVYETDQKRFGDWKNNIGFSADDVDSTWDTTHLRDADGIAEKTENNFGCFNQQKVYLDAFVQQSTPGGSRYPDANKALNDNIFKGQLITSYLGHGGPKGLSQERVLQIADIRKWNNINKLPVFITATCSFTGFDNPNFTSAGEHLILNNNGGAVALFTTVRSVYASSNRVLTSKLYDKIFDRDENGLPLRLGDIIINSQNDGNNTENTRKFVLMGDPSQRIALPTYGIEVTKFDDKIVTSETLDTLGSLSRSSLEGKIINVVDSTTISNFNGTVSVVIYDKKQEQSTLVNDGNGSPLKFNLRKNVLYKGTASVTNGIFSLDFILPKDIDFNYGLGKVSFYATDNINFDASGCYDKLIVGGASETIIEDNEGPEIDIYFNDRSFSYGGKTNSEPILIVDLKDENGINLSSSSIGHDISAALEEQTADKIVLNDFYEPTTDKVGEGTVTYQMSELTPGVHSIYIKAWDILNNSSEKMSEFLVASDEEGFLENVYNYPNPFSTNTDFTFEHDLINANVNIIVDIYTISGKLVKQIEAERYSSGSRITDINWDAKDDYGSKLAKGIYLYKIKLSSSELNMERESDFNKLVILN